MTDWTVVVAACVGVGGTLTAPILTQRAALRARRLDAELQRREREEGQIAALQGKSLEDRRNIYVELNTKLRSYRAALQDLYAFYTGERPDRSILGRVTAARKDFGECYGRAQMIIPDAVLPYAHLVNSALERAYVMLTDARGNEQRLTAASELVELELGNDAKSLRTAMRIDLGVTAASQDLPIAQHEH